MTTAPSSDRVRLHITPFNHTLFSKLIPPTLEAEATNISFHATQVSPDKGFGYVELPAMAADKLKKKLNGAILKGEKVKVSDAKPEKRRQHEDADTEPAEEQVAGAEKPQRKKRKVTEKVEEGVELPEGRSVKRGWTETSTGGEKKQKRERSSEEKAARKEKKEAKKREGSKYTTEPEALVKVRLEPTAATTEALDAKAAKKEAKRAKKEDKQRKGKDEKVVHEFENTTKFGGFLKENQVKGDTSMTTEYVEGKGWVDADGAVVEAEKPSKKRKKEKKFSVDLVPSIETRSAADAQSEALRPDSGIAFPESASSKPAIHPLEALYKRPKPASNGEGTKSTSTSPKKPPPIDTSKAAFSFFDADAEADEAGAEATADGRPDLLLPPMTPKTKQDFQMRGLRSAAPEPDTATHERRFSFSDALAGIQEDDEDVQDGADAHEENDVEGNYDAMDVDAVAEDANGEDGTEERSESAFRKWFYEHRGENNRAWRQKRREAMKVKRQRENRRLARRIVV